MKRNHSCAWHKESGAALIAVLVLLSTISILVMSMGVLSQLAVYGTHADAEKQRSAYVAEGAMNRIIWMIAADNNVYNTSDLSTFDYSEYEDERFVPDGADRTLDYYGTTVHYRIDDGAGGISVDGDVSSALNQLTSVRATDDETVADAKSAFQTRWSDYTDSDDLVSVDDNGMESSEYEEINMQPLPRNGALRYKEELWWIPDGFRLFPPDRNGRLTMVNPIGVTASGNGNQAARPSIFQANYALLTNYANLESDDAREVLQQLKVFRRDRTVLSEVLDPLIWQNLQNYFQMQSSGYYRVTIENAASDGRVSMRLDGTFADPGMENSGDKSITFYDWMLY